MLEEHQGHVEPCGCPDDQVGDLASNVDLISSQDLIQDTVTPVKQTKGLTVSPNGHFQVQIWYRGKSRYVGSYLTQDEAASAYQIADEVLFISTTR